jgi:repressor LexA
MTGRLTARQQEILVFIEAELGRRGIPPTVREIAKRFGIKSTNAVAGHLKALEAKGYIRKEPGLSRGIDISSKSVRPGYPLAGEVAAGLPVLATQSDDEALTLDEAAGARPGDFLLRVKGDSMVGAGINPGDLALVRPGQELRNGDIVVVVIAREEATLKRIFKEQGGRIRLVPENPEYEEIILDPRLTPVSIAGKVVGVIRRY